MSHPPGRSFFQLHIHLLIYHYLLEYSVTNFWYVDYTNISICFCFTYIFVYLPYIHLSLFYLFLIYYPLFFYFSRYRVFVRVCAASSHRPQCHRLRPQHPQDLRHDEGKHWFPIPPIWSRETLVPYTSDMMKGNIGSIYLRHDEGKHWLPIPPIWWRETLAPWSRPVHKILLWE